MSIFLPPQHNQTASRCPTLRNFSATQRALQHDATTAASAWSEPFMSSLDTVTMGVPDLSSSLLAWYHLDSPEEEGHNPPRRKTTTIATLQSLWQRRFLLLADYYYSIREEPGNHEEITGAFVASTGSSESTWEKESSKAMLSWSSSCVF